ncbi:MAG: hypothetical protein HDQ88_06465 [Clostridia bacterium]|nr:hypothetical protein [Clostridia bacterium]
MKNCFFCGKAHDTKTPSGFPYHDAYYPCPDCQRTMDNAITVLSVARTRTRHPEISAGIWPTGDFMVVPMKYKNKIFDPDLMPFAEQAIKASTLVCVEESVFKRLRIKYDTLREKGK